MGRVSSKQNTRQHVFGAKQLDYHGLSSSSLPWFPKVTSKPPISRFCWHFLFISLETGIIGLRQTLSEPRVEWIQYEFCVCVCSFVWLAVFESLNLFWTFPKLANFLYTSTVPVSLAKSERSGNAPSTLPCGRAEWWLLSIEGACALWFSSVSTTLCVTSLVLGTLDTPPRPKE